MAEPSLQTLFSKEVKMWGAKREFWGKGLTGKCDWAGKN